MKIIPGFIVAIVDTLMFIGGVFLLETYIGTFYTMLLGAAYLALVFIDESYVDEYIKDKDNSSS